MHLKSATLFLKFIVLIFIDLSDSTTIISQLGIASTALNALKNTYAVNGYNRPQRIFGTSTGQRIQISPNLGGYVTGGGNRQGNGFGRPTIITRPQNIPLVINQSQRRPTGRYSPPDAFIEPFYPTGLRLSIPDEPGISQVTVLIKVNEDFHKTRAYQVPPEAEIQYPKNGKWTYEDKRIKLNINDRIFYWMQVVYNGRQYNVYSHLRNPQGYKVTGYYNLVSQKDENNRYLPADAIVEPLVRGVRLSIPDEEGISLVAFHIKVNRKFDGIEAGTIARDITKPKNGRWTLEDHTLKLNLNDVVYYWVHVVYNGRGYNHFGRPHTVTGYFKKNEDETVDESESDTNVTPSRPQYVPPAPLVEPLSPAGLRLSIPDQKGISLVAFHIKFNQDFNGLEAGTIARDIIKPKNGRWIYEDKTTALEENDTIYYWIHVVYKELGYNLVNQMYRVKVFYDYNGNRISETENTEKITDQDTKHDAAQENENKNQNENENDVEDKPETNSKAKTFLETCLSDRSSTDKDDVSNLIDVRGSMSVYDNSNQCEQSLTKIDVPRRCTKNLCKGQLIFEDTFDDLNQLRKNWVVEERFSDAPDYEFVVYRDNIKNIYAKQGLKIMPKLLQEDYGSEFIKNGNLTLNKCTEKPGSFDCTRKGSGWNILHPVTSGRVNSKDNLQFRYGRIEIKAKFPQGDWIYPLLMLEPAEYSDKNSVVQIRIASANGNRVLRTEDKKDISGHIVWGGTTGNDIRELKNRIHDGRPTSFNKELWSASYHVYEIVWSPDSIELRVDGNTYGKQEVQVPGNSPYYLTLGVAVGGIYEYPDASESESSSSYMKPWRNAGVKAALNFFEKTNIWHKTWSKTDSSLLVDYVKFWAL